MIWAERYRPSSVKQIVGNEETRIIFLEWLVNWKSGSKPILLAGPPGVGKTTLVKAAAKDLSYDMVELNASDVRTKEKLLTVVPALLTNASILNKKTLLFLDEVDGMGGRGDRGGFATLISLLKNPTIPIVLASNAETGEHIKELKRVATMVKFKRISPRLQSLYLDYVLRKENAKIGIDDKIRLITVSNGDMRVLLNEAQSLASSGFAESFHLTGFTVEISKAMNDFFSSEKVEDAVEMLSRSEGFYSDPRFAGYDTEKRRTDKLAALFSSIVTSKVDVERMADLLKALAESDVLIGKMGQTRQWRLLRYIDKMLAYKLFPTSRGLSYTQYDIPFVLMNRVFRDARMIRSMIALLAKSTHASRRKTAEYLPYLFFILAHAEDNIDEFLAANDLDSGMKELIEKEMGRVVKVKVKKR